MEWEVQYASKSAKVRRFVCCTRVRNKSIDILVYRFQGQDESKGFDFETQAEKLLRCFRKITQILAVTRKRSRKVTVGKLTQVLNSELIHKGNGRHVYCCLNGKQAN